MSSLGKSETMLLCHRSHDLTKIPDSVSPLGPIATLYFCKACYISFDEILFYFKEKVVMKHNRCEKNYTRGREISFKLMHDWDQEFEENKKELLLKWNEWCEESVNLRIDEIVYLWHPMWFTANIGYFYRLQGYLNELWNVEAQILNVFWTYMEESFYVDFRQKVRYHAVKREIKRWQRVSFTICNVECAICYDVIIECPSLPCGHQFDKRCLQSAKRHGLSQCPLCRADIRHVLNKFPM